MRYTYILLLFISHLSFGQKEDVNWFFGDSLLLNFNDGIITPTQVSGRADETCVSISDTAGNLLFYSDGSLVWNTNFEIMDNSYLDIDQYVDGTGSSLSQGSLILPDPGNANQYYMFNLFEFGISYSIVDINLNGGLGDVKIDAKNIYLDVDTYLTEKLQAVKHGNGKDWWILFHAKPPSFTEDSTNTFFELLLTSEGILGPFVVNAGKKKTYLSSIGQMTFSPQGDKLAYTNESGLEVLNFDRCIGDISEFVSSDSMFGSHNPYGCAFSSDGNKVYVSSSHESGDKIYQYCLNCKDEFENTKTLIYKESFDNYAIGHMLLGPDDKIYFVTYYYTWYNPYFTPINMNLSVINSPNNEGLACDVDTLTIYLGGRRSTFGLPNKVNYNLGVLEGSECDTLDVSFNTISTKNEITIYPNPATDHLFINALNNFNNTELIITDATGKTILTQTLTAANNKINITTLSKGIYFVNIKREGEVIYSDSFVKQ
ncbi:MAG: T9SS type A sorting domain-containing protein [Fimbriimonadaceae bacterium]|nr:T9SS type A sorting domain-containing protein [Chitinophagales bacterium]